MGYDVENDVSVMVSSLTRLVMADHIPVEHLERILKKFLPDNLSNITNAQKNLVHGGQYARHDSATLYNTQGFPVEESLMIFGDVYTRAEIEQFGLDEDGVITNTFGVPSSVVLPIMELLKDNGWVIAAEASPLDPEGHVVIKPVSAAWPITSEDFRAAGLNGWRNMEVTDRVMRETHDYLKSLGEEHAHHAEEFLMTAKFKGLLKE